MRKAAAAAGMVSAAILFAPGCGGGSENKASASDPVRRDGYRSLAARDFLLGCPGSPARLETRRAWERSYSPERNRQAVEAIVAGGGEESQRVPPLSPDIANPRLGIQNHEREVSAGEMITDGQPRLAAANDDGLHALGFMKIV